MEPPAGTHEAIRFYGTAVKNHCLRLRNDLYCVEWGVKLYSLTHRQADTTFAFLLNSFLTENLPETVI